MLDFDFHTRFVGWRRNNTNVRSVANSIDENQLFGTDDSVSAIPSQNTTQGRQTRVAIIGELPAGMFGICRKKTPVEVIPHAVTNLRSETQLFSVDGEACLSEGNPMSTITDSKFNVHRTTRVC